jgi:2-oxoglutarate ferredoxin oxidoreductase subunit beta
VNPLALALSAGATFIAQSFSSDAMRHAEIVQEAIEHDGFGFVNVFSPCVTFNDVDTYDYFRDSLVDVADTDHDRSDYDAAKEIIMDMDKEYQGVLYQNEAADSYEQSHGVTENTAEIPDGAPEGAMDLVREFY